MRNGRARRPGRVLALLAALVLLAAGAALALGRDGDGGAEPDDGGEIVLTAPDRQPPKSGTATAPPESPATGNRRGPVERALESGVNAAARLGGAVEAAVVLDGGAPIVAAAPGAPDRAMRAWSMSKVLTAIALLRELGWGERPGRPLSGEAEQALEAALVRSENCRQRRVVLELQRVAGGSPTSALAALADTAAIAGTSIEMVDAPEPPEPICQPFLGTQREIADPLAPGLLLGTSTWTVASAARLAHALGAGLFGAALSDRVLDSMRAPKQASRETPAGDYTAALDWGAGRALAGFRPAYKAGWGGTLQGAFLVGQLAVLELPGGGTAGIAVAFHPDTQPPKDDPGLTSGPEAVEAVMQAVGEELADAPTRR